MTQDSKDLCKRKAIEQAKAYFEKAKAINYDRELTNLASARLTSLAVI